MVICFILTNYGHNPPKGSIMITKTLVAVVLLTLTTSVYAKDDKDKNPCENSGNNCNNTVVAPVTNNKVVNNPITVQANTQSNEQWLYLGYSNTDLSVQSAYSNSSALGGAGGTATANGGSANSTNTVSSSAQGGSVAASGNATNSGNNTGTSTVVVQGDQAQDRNPVSTAVAPTIMTGNDQCLVPVALGGQAVGFGISFGVALRDENCEVLKLSRQIEYLVDKQAAIHFLRMHDKRVDEALKALGK